MPALERRGATGARGRAGWVPARRCAAGRTPEPRLGPAPFIRTPLRWGLAPPSGASRERLSFSRGVHWRAHEGGGPSHGCVSAPPPRRRRSRATAVVARDCRGGGRPACASTAARGGAPSGGPPRRRRWLRPPLSTACRRDEVGALPTLPLAAGGPRPRRQVHPVDAARVRARARRKRRAAAAAHPRPRRRRRLGGGTAARRAPPPSATPKRGMRGFPLAQRT